MSRPLLSRRWLFWHGLTVLGVLVCLLLGWWQIDRAESSSGSWQNIAYAVQWPMFAAFFVYAWARAIRLELHPPAETERPQLATRRIVELRPPQPLAIEPRRSAAEPADDPADDGDDDPELAAYNRYLSSLNNPGGSDDVQNTEQTRN